MLRPMIYASACCAALCMAAVLVAVCAFSGGGLLPASPVLVLGSIAGVGFCLIAAQWLALGMLEALWQGNGRGRPLLRPHKG